MKWPNDEAIDEKWYSVKRDVVKKRKWRKKANDNEEEVMMRINGMCKTVAKLKWCGRR